MNRLILLLLLISLIPFGCEEAGDSENGGQSEVDVFLIELNPDLYQTVFKMREEIALADKKIQQLYDLKGMYPSQRDMIDRSLKQWQDIRKDLKFTLDNISNKVEGAYVAYKIDEIQGRKKFSAISKALLKDANAVLADAEVTKATIERELYE